ncbi:uncharacterized protein LOC144954141 isoform X2 [Lampetra fluviatilis]
MEWMAEDFAQERRWKIAAAKTLCVSVSRHVRREAARRLREESRRGAALRTLARHAASAVTQFWENMGRVVRFKEQTLVEAAESRDPAPTLCTNQHAAGTGRKRWGGDSEGPCRKRRHRDVDDERTLDEEEALSPLCDSGDGGDESAELLRLAALPLSALLECYASARDDAAEDATETRSHSAVGDTDSRHTDTDSGDADTDTDSDDEEEVEEEEVEEEVWAKICNEVPACLQEVTLSVPKLVMSALDADFLQKADLSPFDFLSRELSHVTRYAASHFLPRHRPSLRGLELAIGAHGGDGGGAQRHHHPIKASRLFAPVPYGEEPMGKTTLDKASTPSTSPPADPSPLTSTPTATSAVGTAAVGTSAVGPPPWGPLPWGPPPWGPPPWGPPPWGPPPW